MNYSLLSPSLAEDALNPVGNVYEGFWTDWTKGSVLGRTLTLNQTRSSFLTNGLTMFVTLCGIQLWTIVRFMLHKRGSTLQQEMPTPHLKQQLVLRNAGTAFATARRMIELAWTFRKHGARQSVRVYSIAVSAALFAVLFTAAGLFASKAVSTVSADGFWQVQLRSNQCGIWNETWLELASSGSLDDDKFPAVVQFTSKNVREVQHSLEYTQNCYLSNVTTNSLASTCHTMKSPTIGSNNFSSGHCPFDPRICHNATSTVVMDTGYIDSHHDLGINAKPSDRLKYRSVTNCTVLNGTSFVRGWNGSRSDIIRFQNLLNTAYAYYGAQLVEDTPWTYAFSNFESFETNFTAGGLTPYHLNVEQVYAPTNPQWSSSSFEPIPELFTENADVVLIFLSFNGDYLGEVNDPWFSAHQEQLHGSRTLFTRDEAISTLACAEQHQFCTYDNVCTDLLGIDQVQNVDFFNSAMTPNQNATFDRTIRAVGDSRFWNVIQALARSSEPLQATTKTFAGKSGLVVSQTLPDFQWRIELAHWHSIAMAHLQRTIVQWATGQIAPESQTAGYLLPPKAQQDIWFCNSLVVPSSSFQSFSVLAVSLILVLGMLIIFMGLYIEHLSPKKHWDDDDMLELQRRSTRARRRFPASMQSEMPTIPRHTSSVTFEPTLDQPSSTFRAASDNQSSLHTNYLTVPPTFSRPSPSQPPTRTARGSWMTISLNSLDSASPESPSNTIVANEIGRRLTQKTNLGHSTTTTRADIWTEWNIVSARGTGWV